MEDSTGLGDLEVPKKSSTSEAGGPNSSSRLVNRFLTPIADPSRKRSIIITVPEDARVISAPVGVASYLRYLVTDEDHAKMNDVDAPCLLNEAQHVLKRVRCC